LRSSVDLPLYVTSIFNKEVRLSTSSMKYPYWRVPIFEPNKGPGGYIF